MPTRAAHHRAPPPPPRHTTHASTHHAPTHHTPTHAPSSTHAAAHTTPPGALVDRQHAATTTPHLDGFDHAPRTPYGVRLGGDDHLTLGSTTAAAPDLRARDVPTAPAPLPREHAQDRQSIMEQAMQASPFSTPDYNAVPTLSLGTNPAVDGTHTSDVTAAIDRGASRLDAQGREQSIPPPPVLGDQQALDLTRQTQDEINRAVFSASPEGTSAATGGRSQ